MVVKKLCMTICMLIAMLIASTDGLSQEYYTLAEIKEQAKNGWHEIYRDKYNREIQVNIEIDVFGKEKTPVIKADIPEFVEYFYNHGSPYDEVIDVARKVTNFDICAVEEPRRSGDPAVLIASSEKAKSVLGWKPEFDSLEKIIEDAWNWHRNNVNGYATVIDNSK